MEEPPPRVAFIMATTERHKVPETILSRCQQFEFRTIATVRILERLRLIADAEKITIPEEALREIARSGEGSMRDAQSAFDQVISFAGTTIQKEDVEMALGVAGVDTLIRVVNGIANNQPAEALAVVDDVVMRGHDLRNFCRELLAHFRDLLVTKVSGSDELLESATCERDELKRQAELFSEADLVRFFHSLAETETLLKTAAHPRYQLEVGLVKLMEMRRLETLGHLMARLEILEASVRTRNAPATSPAGAKAVSATSRQSTPRSSPQFHSPQPGSPVAVGETAPPPPYPSSAPERTKSASSSKGAAAASPAMYSEAETTAAKVQPAEAGSIVFVAGSEIEQIKSLLEKRRKMFLVTALEGAHEAAIEGDELCIEFAPGARHLRDTLSKGENVKILREVCKEITSRDLGVRFVIKDNEAGGVPISKEETERRAEQDLRGTVEKDPVVQQMLRTFRGEIVDVTRVDGKE
jgi:DNA polymerase-3 subunit gamma/tau